MFAPKVSRLPTQFNTSPRENLRDSASSLQLHATRTSDDIHRKERSGAPGQAGLNGPVPKPSTPVAPLPRLRPLLLQTKLRIGALNDPLEREADHMADRVMQMNLTKVPSLGPPQLQRKCPDCEKEEKEATAPASLKISRKCAHCEEEDKVMQKKSDTSSSSAQSNHHEAPPLVRDVLRSPGQPLADDDLAFFTPRFGFDFRRVRIHTDRTAAESAQSVNALAYASGSNIAFAAGQYQPGTDSGRLLLAHELAHVVQQNGSQTLIQRAPADDTTDPWDKLTPEAKEEADSVSGFCMSWIKTLSKGNLAHVSTRRSEWLNDLSLAYSDIGSATSESQVDHGVEEYTNWINEITSTIAHETEEWDSLQARYRSDHAYLLSRNVKSTDSGEAVKYLDEIYNRTKAWMDRGVIDCITDEDYLELKFVIDSGRHFWIGAIRGARIRSKRLDDMMDQVWLLRRQGQEAEKTLPHWDGIVLEEAAFLDTLAERAGNDISNQTIFVGLRDDLLERLRATLAVKRASDKSVAGKAWAFVKGGTKAVVGGFVEAAKEAVDLAQIAAYFATAGIYEARLISDMAEAADQGATTRDLLVGMVTGIIYTPERFLEACDNDDWEAIGTEAVNLYELAKLVKESPKIISKTIPNAAKQIPELLEKTKQGLKLLHEKVTALGLKTEARLLPGIPKARGAAVPHPPPTPPQPPKAPSQQAPALTPPLPATTTLPRKQPALGVVDPDGSIRPVTPRKKGPVSTNPHTPDPPTAPAARHPPAANDNVHPQQQIQQRKIAANNTGGSGTTDTDTQTRMTRGKGNLKSVPPDKTPAEIAPAAADNSIGRTDTKTPAATTPDKPLAKQQTATPQEKHANKPPDPDQSHVNPLGKDETGAQLEDRLLAEDRANRAPNSDTFHAYEGGKNGSFRLWAKNLGNHITKFLSGTRQGLHLNPAVLDEVTQSFIHRHPNLRAAWDALRITREERDAFERGPIGSKRPDLVEVFFGEDRAVITDITQKVGDPFHRFKSSLYIEIVREVTGLREVDAMDFKTVRDQHLH